jgi:hypothetical protein
MQMIILGEEVETLQRVAEPTFLRDNDLVIIDGMYLVLVNGNQWLLVGHLQIIEMLCRKLYICPLLVGVVGMMVRSTVRVMAGSIGLRRFSLLPMLGACTFTRLT